MRLPLATSLKSRDGTVTKDAKTLNALLEVDGEELKMRKRPGNRDAGLIKAGVAQAATYWNDTVVTVQADYINVGSLVGCTWNSSDKGTAVTLSNGDLSATATAASSDSVRSVVSKSSGKWYFEVTIDSATANNPNIGVANVTLDLNASIIGSNTHGLAYRVGGDTLYNGTAVSGLATATTNDVIGVAFDADGRTVSFYKNGTLLTTETSARVPAGALYAAVGDSGGSPAGSVTANFGATAFANAAPTGYSALGGSLKSMGTITSTALSPTTASLPFSMQDNGSSAPKSYLMFKNATQAWTVDTASTVAAITDVDYPGTFSYAETITGITRSSTTATATLAQDTNFHVGDSVTIAGAVQTDYNGAKTILAITAASTSTTPGTTRNIAITIARSSTTATATSTSEPHGLTNGAVVTISGCVQPEYNGNKTITWLSATTFSFTVTVTAAVAATTITTPATTQSGATLYAFSKTRYGTVSFNAGGTVATITLRGHGYATGGKVIALSYGYTIDFLSAAITVVDVDTFTVAVIAGSQTFFAGKINWPVEVTVDTRSNITGITGSGSTATITTSVAHGFSAGDLLTVNGAVPSYYNVSQVPIVITSSTTFTYTTTFIATAATAEAPASPATGSPIISASVPGTSTVVGASFTFTVANSPTTPATTASSFTATGNTSGRKTVSGIVYMDGYFVVMDIYGVLYSSKEDDPSTWDALEYVGAVSENGKGKAVARSGQFLIALKEWSTEPFFTNPANKDGSPFSPVPGAHSAIGCAAGESVAEVGGKLFWIAQEKKQKGWSVYMMLGTEQVRISTPDVDRVLAADDLVTIYAFGITLDGHTCYVLSLVTSGITLIYDATSKAWGQWTCLTIGSSASISGITRDGDVVTVTFAAAHGLSDGDPLLIAGASQSDYNGIKQVSYVSTTVVTFITEATPVTPATGTITGTPYTESYYKFTRYTQANGKDLVLHVSDGHAYELLSSLKQDSGLPINLFSRTERLDGGDARRKKCGRASIVGDTADDRGMIRWSDDDSTTFETYRSLDLSEPEPNINRLGGFQRRSFEFRHIGNTAPVLQALELEVSR